MSLRLAQPSARPFRLQSRIQFLPWIQVLEQISFEAYYPSHPNKNVNLRLLMWNRNAWALSAMENEIVGFGKNHSSVDPDHPRVREHHRRFSSGCTLIQKKTNIWPNLGFVLSKRPPCMPLFFYLTFFPFSFFLLRLCATRTLREKNYPLSLRVARRWIGGPIWFNLFISSFPILLDHLTVLISSREREGAGDSGELWGIAGDTTVSQEIEPGVVRGSSGKFAVWRM